MKKLNMENVFASYDEFLEKHGEEVLKDAVKAIQPDSCGMDRDGAIRLAGAMKNCGFSKEDFAEVMARSTQDKGTFAKQWENGKITGSGTHGEATAGTIYQAALASGWEWPEPEKFVEEHALQGDEGASKSAARSKKPQLENMARWKPGITFQCIMDSVGYTKKPNAQEVRGREQSPTPMPDPITIAQFVEAVTSGRTFWPRVYNKVDTGRRDASGRVIYDYYPIKQQLFVVDIDNEEPALDEKGKPIKGKKRRIDNYKTIEDAIEICKQHGVMPFLVYETFSSKEHREDPEAPYKKFRLCFLLDTPVTVRQFGLVGMNVVTKYFIDMFGQAADGKTTDTARLIYGTDEKESIQQYEAVLDSKKIVQAAFAKQLNQDEEEPAPEDPAEQKTSEEMLEDFLQVIQQRVFEPIETGISDLDRALAGGFIRKTLVMLGAAPGMGKTALAQFVFENMAEHGHDVLYINLEMAREQLLARSISRIAWKYYREDLNAIDVLRGYEWTEKQIETVNNAARVYKEKIAQHFVYNPEGVSNDIKSILTAMQSATRRIKEQGRPAPIVCIDYLQLIATPEKDAVEGMKNVIKMLKDYAIQNDTIVFLIMANNRASNKTGTADLESGRDSSAIEYSGDVLLGLVYTAIEERRKFECGEDRSGNPKYKEYDLDEIRRLKKEAYERGEAAPDVCNELSVKVIKNRFGESERLANLLFDGKHSTFKLKEYRYKGRKL